MLAHFQSLVTRSNLQKQPPEVFCKKSCSWTFHKIHRKTPVPFLIKWHASGLRPATLLKKRLWHRCFPVNFSKFLGIALTTEHLWATASKSWYILRKWRQNTWRRLHERLLFGQLATSLQINSSQTVLRDFMWMKAFESLLLDLV